jgi:hypothetical protein
MCALLAGCGDASLFEPERGLAGIWVRVPSPTEASQRIAIAYRDTLELSTDRGGRWSREFEDAAHAPVRVVSEVVLEPHGTRLFMNLAPCTSCLRLEGDARASLVADSPRFTSEIGPPHYRIVRQGKVRFELRPITAGGESTWYVRWTPYGLD